MSYEVRYLIVAGVAWIRHTDGPERAVWLVTFDGRPHARKRLVPELPSRLGKGELDGIAWQLEVEPLSEPHRVPPRVLRPLASSRYELIPAVAVSGHIGDRELERAPGHVGHVWGRRHADRWRWAHASSVDGSWVDILTAKVPCLPELSFWATDRGRGLGSGDFVVEEGDPGGFVGVTYTDPDGSTRICYHTETARLCGPGIDTTAVLELGSREGRQGWPASI